MPTYTAVNATAGTAIAQAVSASFSATAALLTMRNTENVLVRPRQIRLICNTVPASGTNMFAAITIDDIARYSSGGTAITPKCANMAETRTSSVGSLYFGAVVLAAAGTNVRTVGRAQVRSVIPIVGDSFVFKFGNDALAVGATPVNGTAPSIVPHNFAEVILGSGHAMNLHVWYASNAVTPAQYEFEMIWDEN